MFTFFKNLPALFLLLCCVGSQLVFSQKVQQKYFTVYVNNPEDNCSIKAEVCNKKIKLRYTDTLKYYWYGSSKIITTQGASDGKILHGKYSAFYYNSNLKEQGNFRKGLQNGQWMKWNHSGSLLEITNWYRGFRQGKHTLFDSAGSKMYEASYKNGKLHGSSINYSKGTVTSKKRFKKGVEVLPKGLKTGEKPKNKFNTFIEKIQARLKSKPASANPQPENKTNKEKNREERRNKQKVENRSKTKPAPSAVQPESNNNAVQTK